MLRSTRVDSIMSSPVVGTSRTNTLTEARAILKEHSINHLPVLDKNNKPVGMISALDLNQLSDWRTHFKELASVGEKRDQDLFDSLLVEEIMVSPVTSVRESSTVSDAAAIIEQLGIHCVPVTNEAGEILGVVTAHDLLRLAYEG